jgi:predicted lipoprotein with Yx(FWY)xxD motif
MRTLPMLVSAALVAIAGCGGDDGAPATAGQQGEDAALKQDAARAGAKEQRADAPMARGEGPVVAKGDGNDATGKGRGTTVTIEDSEFGEMLFDAKHQAIYIFENDPKGKTVCYDECAEAWPPVFTESDPVAGKGVDASLLGSVKRRDGRLQVTYADQSLYYYANEGRGEVRCHNVDLNGGLWWVVGPDGKRRP